MKLNDSNLNYSKKIGLVSLAFVSFNAMAAENVYIVKDGDNLSEILFAHKLVPIYGSSGTLQKSLHLNSKIRKRKHYKIYPGEKIYLPRGNKKVSFYKKQKKQLVQREVGIIEKEEENLKKITKWESQKIVFDSEKTKDFQWALAPSLGWRELSSSDDSNFATSNIDALSETNYGMTFLSKLSFSDKLNFYSRFFLENATFKENASISLSRKNFLLTSFNFGLNFDRMYFFELGMEDQLFLTSSEENNVEIKTAIAPKLEFDYQREVYNKSNSSIYVTLLSRLFLPRASSNVRIQNGYGGGLSCQIKYLSRSFVLGYNYDQLKSKLNTTKSQNIFWKFLWEIL